LPWRRRDTHGVASVNWQSFALLRRRLGSGGDGAGDGHDAPLGDDARALCDTETAAAVRQRRDREKMEREKMEREKREREYECSA
jgi:hypothetical protein